MAVPHLGRRQRGRRRLIPRIRVSRPRGRRHPILQSTPSLPTPILRLTPPPMARPHSEPRQHSAHPSTPACRSTTTKPGPWTTSVSRRESPFPGGFNRAAEAGAAGVGAAEAEPVYHRRQHHRTLQRAPSCLFRRVLLVHASTLPAPPRNRAPHLDWTSRAKMSRPHWQRWRRRGRGQRFRRVARRRWWSFRQVAPQLLGWIVLPPPPALPQTSPRACLCNNQRSSRQSRQQQLLHQACPQRPGTEASESTSRLLG